MMTLGEAIGGFTIYYYHESNWKQKKQAKYFGLQLLLYLIYDLRKYIIKLVT